MILCKVCILYSECIVDEVDYLWIKFVCIIIFCSIFLIKEIFLFNKEIIWLDVFKSNFEKVIFKDDLCIGFVVMLYKI